MQFSPTVEQDALVDAVEVLLGRYAGPARARELGGDQPRYDSGLEEALGSAGFLECAHDPDAGPLAAALVTEAAAHTAGVAAIGARALVAAALCPEPLAEPVALTVAGHRGPVRYGADARTLLVAGAHDVWVVPLEPGAVERVRSRFGYPMGRVPESLLPGADGEAGGWLIEAGGRLVEGGSPARMLAWWRVALGAELVGTMRSAFDMVLEHVKTRVQFGRPIGSFQALQHRLAEIEVLLEGSRWLVLEAAWAGSQEAAAVALTQAVVAARRLLLDAHQMTGALGFTTEFDLHLWTMRLPALIQESEWMGSPAAAVSAERWPGARP